MNNLNKKKIEQLALKKYDELKDNLQFIFKRDQTKTFPDAYYNLRDVLELYKRETIEIIENIYSKLEGYFIKTNLLNDTSEHFYNEVVNFQFDEFDENYKILDALKYIERKRAEVL